MVVTLLSPAAGPHAMYPSTRPLYLAAPTQHMEIAPRGKSLEYSVHASHKHANWSSQYLPSLQYYPTGLRPPLCRHRPIYARFVYERYRRQRLCKNGEKLDSLLLTKHLGEHQVRGFVDASPLLTRLLRIHSFPRPYTRLRPSHDLKTKQERHLQSP